MSRPTTTIAILLTLLGAAATVAAQTTPPASAPDAPVRPAAPADAPGAAEPSDDAALPIPASIELVRGVVYATAAQDDGTPVDLLLDAAFPKTSDRARLPVVVYVHGGGYVGGSRTMGLPFILAFARGGYFAVTIDYRLAPASRFPAAVHDCKGAIRFLRANAEVLGIDPDRIGVWGHSAGGHLSALLGVSGNQPQLDGAVGPPGTATAVACAVSVSGPSHFDSPTAQARGFLDAWFGEPGEPGEARARRVAQAGSAGHVDPEDPPILLVHGEVDRLVPIEHSERLHDALRQAGVETELLRVAGQGHLVAAPRAYRRIGEFFDQHLGGSAAAAMADAAAAVAERRDAPRPNETPAP